MNEELEVLETVTGVQISISMEKDLALTNDLRVVRLRSAVHAAVISVDAAVHTLDPVAEWSLGAEMRISAQEIPEI